MVVLASMLLGPGIALAQEGLRPGVKAPDFTLSTVQDKVVSLKDAAAKGTVILHFWKSK